MTSAEVWCEDLVNQLEHLQQDYETSQIKLAQFQSAAEQLRVAQQEATEQQQAFESIKAQHERLSTQHEQAQQEALKQQHALTSIQAQHDDLSAQHAKLQRAYSEPKHALAFSKVQHEDAVSELEEQQDDHAEQMRSLSAGLDWLRDRSVAEHQRKELASSKAQHEQLSTQHEKLQKALQESVNAAASAQGEHEAAVKQLQEVQEAYDHKWMLWNAEMKELEEANMEHWQRHRQFLEECQHVIGFEESAEDEEALHENTPTLFRKHSTLGKAMDGKFTVEEQLTLSALHGWKDKLQQVESQLDDARAENASICRENDDLQDEVLRQEKRLDTIKPKVKKTVRRLQNEVKSLKERSAQAAQALHSAQQQASKFKRQHAQQEAQHAQQAKQASRTAQQHQAGNAAAMLEQQQQFKSQLQRAQQEAQHAQRDLAFLQCFSKTHDEHQEMQIQDLVSTNLQLEKAHAAAVSVLRQLHSLASQEQVSPETLLNIFATPIPGESSATQHRCEHSF